jgi:GNAT superfamily N-acetyltransferase
MNACMNTNDFSVRTMGFEELAFACDLAADEGWNPGLDDARVFFDTDPEGFLVALQKEKPVGCISAVSYDDTFGFVGFYIVRPEYRGGRIGVELGRAALARLGNRSIGIDGVFAKVPNYAAFGFELAYRNIRYELRDTAPACAPHPQAGHCVPGTTFALADYVQYEKGLFPVDRPAFLRGWLAMPHACVLVYEENGAMRGYGVLRQCRSGGKIGPLFADAPGVADCLFRELIQRAAFSGPVYLDVPEINVAAVKMAEGYGMTSCFGTARMYLNGRPPLDEHRIFGITSFELG